MDERWALDLRDQCALSGIAFFFKQWGGVRAKTGGRELEGRTWDDMPDQPPTKRRSRSGEWVSTLAVDIGTAL